MAQAIVNNLDNMLTDFAQQDRCADFETDNFSQILEIKTAANTNDTTINANDTNCTSNVIQSNLTENLTTALENDEIKPSEAILDVISEVIAEAVSDLPTSFAIVQENDVIQQTISQADNTENTTIETDEKTITNEVSTMKTQQILTPPPENPMVHMLLQNDKNQLMQTDEVEQNSTVTHLKELSFKNEDAKSSLKNFNLIDSEKNRIFVEDVPENDEVITKIENTKLSDCIDDAIVEELNIESIESEVGGNQQESSDLMQNQSPQEQGVKAVIQGNVKFDDTSLQVQSQVKSGAIEANAGKILEQISKQMENMYNGSKVNIVLNPEALGKVALQLINSKEGLVAQFTVTNQDVKNILMKGLAGLRESLISQGVSVDNVTVKLADAGDSEYSGDWTDAEGSRGGFKEQNPKHQKDDKKQFEKMMFEIENNGNV